MASKALHSRNVIGRLWHELRSEDDGWVPAVSGTPITTTVGKESFPGLGAIPMLREWKGPRKAQDLRDIDYTLETVKYELTLRVLGEELRRDQVGQVNRRIGEIRGRWQQHWAKIASDKILVGTTENGFDGNPFFGTHTENGVTTGDNAVTSAGGPTPTPSVMEDAIWEGVTAFSTFVDDQGEPAHIDPGEFVIMIPNSPAFIKSTSVALKADTIVDGGTSRTNTLVAAAGKTFQIAVNPRLSAWTDQFVMFVRDGMSMIRLVEVDLEIAAKAEGSEYEFDHDAHEYGLFCQRTIGFGNWQSAVHVTLVP